MTRSLLLVLGLTVSGTAQAACGWAGSASDFFRCLMNTSETVDENSASVDAIEGRVDAVEEATWDLSEMMLTAGEVLSTVAGEGYALLVDVAPVGLTGLFDDLDGVPEGLADGDDDALGRLICAEGDVAIFDGEAWACGSVPGTGEDGDPTMVERLEALEALLEDSDGDGWADLVDNCPDFASDDLTDSDGDGVGDLCDVCDGGADTVDTDGDGVPDRCDVCPDEDDALDADGDGLLDCLVGTPFGDWVWLQGPRGGSCEGVCEAIGLSCFDIVGTGWVETADSNVCGLFYPDLGTSGDGDGPRLNNTNEDGTPSDSSSCIYHESDWEFGWDFCGWTERVDDVRFCPCT